MNIVIIFDTPFPYGDAAANRVISYTREMVRLGHSVTVHSLQPSVRTNEKDNPLVQKPEVEGEIEGVKYIHTAGTIYWPPTGLGKFRKIWLRIKSYIGSARLISKNKENIDIVQVYSHNTFIFNIYYLVTLWNKLKYVCERSELPGRVKHKERYKDNFINRMKFRWMKHAYKYFDAWILETQTLADFYLPLAKEDAKCCIVPMTVEEERFVNVEKSDSPYGRYVGYCGNMREDDGLSILIKAFAQIAPAHPELKLVLAGDSKDVPAQKELTASLGLTNRILFIGRLTRDEIPSFIANADVLCLASPTSARASATMPCKVGEYLCTGNPVVVTGQGEIFKYLKDERDAYVPMPDSVEAFAEKLGQALDNPEEAKRIGKTGKETAIREFGSMTQAKRIVEFFETVIK